MAEAHHKLDRIEIDIWAPSRDAYDEEEYHKQMYDKELYNNLAQALKVVARMYLPKDWDVEVY